MTGPGFLRALPICFMALALYACTASGDLRYVEKKAEPLPTGKTVELSVTSTLESEQAREVVSRVRDELADRLVSAGVFKSVHQSGEESDYRMEVKVVDVEGLPQPANRLAFQLPAETIDLVIHVALYEQPAEKLVTDLDVETESEPLPRSPDISIQQVVSQAATQVIHALQ